MWLQHKDHATWAASLQTIQVVWSITTRRMGVWEEEGLGTGKSSITAEVQCFHLVHFHFIQVDNNIFSQLTLPRDSGSCVSGQCLPYGPTPPSPLKYFYIPLKSLGKSRQWALQMTTSTISSLQKCSPLSQSQWNHGCLNLSLYIAPMDQTSSINMVSCGICIHLLAICDDLWLLDSPEMNFSLGIN